MAVAIIKTQDTFFAYTFAEKISENQYLRLLKGSTVNLKDFKTNSGTVEGNVLMTISNSF
jgi:hypothetical protein